MDFKQGTLPALLLRLNNPIPWWYADPCEQSSIGIQGSLVLFVAQWSAQTGHGSFFLTTFDDENPR